MSTTFAQAEVCDDLWLTRNLIMDRAGHCFASPLALSVFGPNECVAASVTLGRQDRLFVERIKDLEREYGCNIDTSQSELLVPDASFRQSLKDLPVADRFESACLEYRGLPQPLYRGRRSDYAIIGYIFSGDTIHFRHLPVGRWNYVTVPNADGATVSGGWLQEDATGLTCSAYAG